MSVHDRLVRDVDSEPDVLDPKWVGRHRGDYYDALDRHRYQVKEVLKGGRDSLKDIAPDLLRRVADERTIHIAWDHLRDKGGHAPAPDGRTYADFTGSDVWCECRYLRDQIMSGEYEPGPEHVTWIEKGGWRGKRPLVIQSISDRVVQRAVVEIVQPLLDPRFDDRSFGFRPKRDRLHALAMAKKLLVEDHRKVWVTEDVKDAFLNVPLSQLLRLVKKYLIADDLTHFIGKLLGNASTRGLRQGGSLSPLLLNLYLHHHLDKPWRREHPDVPLIRVADDVLLLCRSVDEAKDARAALLARLLPAGMPLKGDPETAVRRLTWKEPAEWLGWTIYRRGKKLVVTLADKAWDNLEDRLALAAREPDPPRRARRVLPSWISQQGPCFPQIDTDKFKDCIVALTWKHVQRTPRAAGMLYFWQRAHARWCKLQLAS